MVRLPNSLLPTYGLPSSDLNPVDYRLPYLGSDAEKSLQNANTVHGRAVSEADQHMGWLPVV